MPPKGGRAYRQHATFKQAIRERDGHRCQTCGRTVGDKGVQQIDVAHIIPYSDCHETKPKNVRILCHSCNLKESGNGNGTAKHLNGDKGARMRSWERKADPEGTMTPAERLAAAKELQREHLANIARVRAELSEAKRTPAYAILCQNKQGGLNVTNRGYTNALATGFNEGGTRSNDLVGQPQKRRRAVAAGRTDG